MSPGSRLSVSVAVFCVFVTASVEAEAADAIAEDDASEDADDGLDIGGYVGLGGRYARLLDRNTGLVCAELAVLFDHTLSIGTGGCGTILSAENTTDDSTADEITLEFGGTVVRYHITAIEPLNLSVGASAGTGKIELLDDGEVRQTDSLILVQPELGIHIFPTEWMRLSAIGAYRIVSGVDTSGVTSRDLSGVSVGINAHFGWF